MDELSMFQSKSYFYLYGISCFHLPIQRHYLRNSPLSFLRHVSLSIKLFSSACKKNLFWPHHLSFAILPHVLFSFGPKHLYRVISTQPFTVPFLLFGSSHSPLSFPPSFPPSLPLSLYNVVKYVPQIYHFNVTVLNTFTMLCIIHFQNFSSSQTETLCPLNNNSLFPSPQPLLTLFYLF